MRDLFFQRSLIRLIQSLLAAGAWSALLMLTLQPAHANVAASTLTVCAGGCGYSTIQAALNAAAPGDVIKVASGTYTENIVITKSISLLGGWTNPPTFSTRTIGASIIEGSNADRVVLITGTASITPLLDGFTIQHGSAANASIDTGKGSGVYINSARAALQNNWIISNSSNVDGSFGGGIAIVGSMAIVSNNLIAGNFVTASVNYKAAGAGIYALDSSASIYSNTIQFNTVYGFGGGIYYVNNVGGLSPLVQKNLIQYNQTLTTAVGNGGGLLMIANDSGFPVIDANRFYSNTSDNGVLGIDSFGPYQVTNNILMHNSLGGIHIYRSGGGAVANNLVLYTQGKYGGIKLRADGPLAYIFNNIVMSNTYGLEVDVGSTSVRGYNLVFHNVISNYVSVNGLVTSSFSADFGDVHSDPLFVNALAGDYHLKDGSPAINKGVTYPGSPARDYDGNLRPPYSPSTVDCRIDIGIFERNVSPLPPCYRIQLPLIMKNH